MCACVSSTFGSVWVCVGGFPLGHNQVDLAVVWSYGIVLHQSIMWACLWRSMGVCRCCKDFWECVGVCGVFLLIAIKRIWPLFGPMASYCIQTSCGHVCGGLRVCVCGCFKHFLECVGVYGGLPLDRN